MRCCAPILAACCLLGIPGWSAEVTFPYTAEVSVADVEVRCGPGWEFYPTMRLERGSKVDVYRHELGGWLAIRPPDGSFSWIPARQVKRQGDSRVGTVLMEGAVAWVGSGVVDVRQHKWQVRLKRDERLQILGKRSLSVGPGFATETHFKIAPPAGEFRWIHAEHASAPGSLPPESSVRAAGLTSPEPHGSARAKPSPWRDPAADAPVVTPVGSNTTDEDLQALQHQVDKLKVDLSLLVSQQSHRWDLEPLRQRAAALADAVEGTSLARQVKLISYRISEFETLQQRHQKMSRRRAADPEKETEKETRIRRHGVPATPRASSTGVEQTNWQQEIEESLASDTTVGTGIDRLAAEMAEPKPKFDAEGWLMTVHTTRRVAPPFALLDKHGRVICYVRPSPGLNLRRYEKQNVGLFGDKKRMSDLRASLLTVTRVVRLDE